MSELRSSLHPLSREELVAKIEQLRQELAAARANSVELRDWLTETQNELARVKDGRIKLQADLAAARALLNRLRTYAPQGYQIDIDAVLKDKT